MEPAPPKNAIPVSLQSLMGDLDFVSQIKRDMKPYFNDRILHDANSWYDYFLRRFKKIGKNHVITKVEEIVNNAIEAIENPKYREHLVLIINELNNALTGIENLAYTYENDPDMKARLNVQIKNVNIQLDRYRQLIKGVKDFSQNAVKKEYIDVSLDMDSISTPSTAETTTTTIDLLDSSSLEFDKKKFKKNFKKKDN